MQLRITGVSHIAVRVTDLKRSRHFYADVLGFPVALETAGLVIVKVGDGLLAISGDAVETKEGDRFDPYRVGLDHLSFAVADLPTLERMKDDLEGAGIATGGITDDPGLNAKALNFKDPDGIALELYLTQG